MPTLERQTFHFETDAGWRLPLIRHRFDYAEPTHKPVLMLTGYGMNSFILGFHPQGRSMIRCLCEAGFEVWTGSMRRQRGARRLHRRAEPPSLLAFADADIPDLIAAVQANTLVRSDAVDLVGSSLGGSLCYAHLALHPDSPADSIIAIGAPLRWDRAHPLLRLAFRSRRVAGWLPMVGSDALARVAFPAIGRVAPRLLSIYMNVDHVDLKDAAQLTRTIDEPDRGVNRNMAEWLRSRDMVLRGVNVTEAMRALTRPLLIITANADGIVPREAARSVLDAWGGEIAEIEVGDDADWYAHADLFIAPDAPDRVFGPMAQWLAAHQLRESRSVATR